MTRPSSVPRHAISTEIELSTPCKAELKEEVSERLIRTDLGSIVDWVLSPWFLYPKLKELPTTVRTA